MVKILKAKESSYYPASQNIFKEVENGKGSLNEIYILPTFTYVLQKNP